MAAPTSLHIVKKLLPTGSRPHMGVKRTCSSHLKSDAMGLKGANWEIVIDGRPRSYRNDLEIAREAGRYLKSKSPQSEVAIRNYATGEVLSITVEQASVAWADGKRARR